MKKIQKILILSLLVVSIQVGYAAKEWESIREEKVVDARVIAQTDEIELRTQKGAIIVTTIKPIEIKVFTILGQLVSQEKLPIGTSQLNIGSHGVYIVKVGELTCKVAL